MRRDWWAPLTGVAFVALLIISFAVGGEPPDAKEGAREIVSHYEDNKGAIQIGAALSVLAASLFVWFGATLRDALRDPGGNDGIAPAVLFAGTIITAVGAAIDAMVPFAMAEAADDGVDPNAFVSLQALWDNDFFPLALGVALFLLASGLSILRRGILPRWMGFIAVTLGVLGFTPVGWIAFMAGGIWVIAVSIMLTLRNRAGGAGAAGDATTADLAGPGPEAPQPVGVTR